MARIKRDPDDWKARGIKKRDFNHSHDEPEVPKKNPSKRKKKDTKTWCRGKVGREHVVADKTPPRLPNYACCSPERERHFAWNHHYTVKCVNCGMDAWRLPERAQAQVDPALAKRLELEDKWCADEGHLYDWERNFIDPPPLYGYSQWWVDNFGYTRYWEYQFCVMCGKKGKSRRWRND